MTSPRRTRCGGRAARWIVLTGLALVLSCATQPRAPRTTPETPDERLGSYVVFLGKPHAKPVDYVMDLYRRHDIVVLCERNHEEITQYDLIHDLIRDERFTRDVGHVFTEIGTSVLQPEVDALLTAAGLSEADLTRRLLAVQRSLSPHPLWANYNYFDFLRRLYRLNQTLGPERKVHVHPSDMPFRWEEMTPETYERFMGEASRRRDRVIADQIIATFRTLGGAGDERRKALVIMNSRHAFNDVPADDGERGNYVGRYLFEAFPGLVANVLLNSVVPRWDRDASGSVGVPFQQGKWDAAFHLAGNPAVGFDFRGSPFGEDRFELAPWQRSSVGYQDVFTGFLFWRPLEEHALAVGIPGLIDAPFAKELARRLRIAGHTKVARVARPWMVRLGGWLWLNRSHRKTYDQLAEFERAIEAWLE